MFCIAPTGQILSVDTHWTRRLGGGPRIPGSNWERWGYSTEMISKRSVNRTFTPIDPPQEHVQC